MLRFIFRLDIEVPDEEEDEDAIIAKRRKQRQALLQVTSLYRTLRLDLLTLLQRSGCLCSHSNFFLVNSLAVCFFSYSKAFYYCKCLNISFIMMLDIAACNLCGICRVALGIVIISPQQADRDIANAKARRGIVQYLVDIQFLAISFPTKIADLKSHSY